VAAEAVAVLDDSHMDESFLHYFELERMLNYTATRMMVEGYIDLSIPAETDALIQVPKNLGPVVEYRCLYQLFSTPSFLGMKVVSGHVELAVEVDVDYLLDPDSP